MGGSSKISEQIRDLFKLARKKVFGEVEKVELNSKSFLRPDTIGQLGLF